MNNNIFIITANITKFSILIQHVQKAAFSMSYIQTCKQILIIPADGRRYSSTAHEVANPKAPEEGKQESAEKDTITYLYI